MRFTTLAFLTAVTYASTAAAQQQIGILLNAPSSTTPGNACGFD